MRKKSGGRVGRARRNRRRRAIRLSILLSLAGCVAGVCALGMVLLASGDPQMAVMPTSRPVEKEVRTMPDMTPIALSAAGDSPEASIPLVNWENPIDYEPEELVPVNLVCSVEYVEIINYQHLIDKTAGAAANEMFQAATEEGIGRFIINSAYRSVEAQEAIWEARISKNPDYGKNPFQNPVKAMPGSLSEHATGLAIDILSVNYNTADDGFGDSEEGRWLAENAHKFGFIQRYPQDKEHITGVIYEPWHYRYVGVDVATEIYESGLCLEEYLGQA